MQFMALIYSDPAARAAPGSPDSAATLDAYRQATQSYRDGGHFIAGDALLGTETAKSLRLRGGQAMVTDGPFADTKEHLGGYYLLNCDSMEQALIAGRC